MSFRIDIGQPDPDLYGDDTLIGGGIATALYWRSTARMDRAGTIEFAIPAGDPKASLVQPLYIARCWALLGGTWQQIAAGIIERIERKIDGAGNVLIVASGPDLLGELVTRLPYYAFAWTGGGAGVTLTTALGDLNNLSRNWLYSLSGTAPQDTVYGAPILDPILATMVSLAQRTYTHFYAVPGQRAVVYTPDWTDSGVRAVQAAGDLAAETCAITSLMQIDDAAEVVTEIYPFGAGNAEARLTIQATNRTPPDGYIIRDSSLGYSIYSQAAEAIYGSQLRVAVRQWTDITPLSSTDADVQTAANALYDEALLWLQQHEQPQRFYSVNVAGASVILRPMQTIRLVFRDPDQGLDIDADLYILEATTEATAEGVATVGMTVATVDRYPDSDVGEMAKRLTQAQLYATQPQLNANSYVLPYSKNVDQTETANFRFRFDTEVWQLTRVTFDFQLLPLESTVKTVGLEQSTGGTITTSFSGSSGDSGTASTGGPSVTNTGSSTGDTGAATGDTGAATGNTGSSTGDTGGSGTLTTDGPQGGDVISSGRHQHAFTITLGAGSVTYPVGYGAAGTSGGLISTAPGGTHDYTTSQSGNHDHDVDGHQHSLNSHQHSLNSHQHSLNNHQHSLNNHQHSLNNHQHTIDHQHTINHSHTFTPSVYTSYGIYRDSGSNVFAVTDLEYSLDGSTWYNFTVGVNGYTTLGDSWVRVDLTALLQNSTTLRPNNANNLLRIRRKSTGATGKMATIDAQMNVRTIIQAVALT